MASELQYRGEAAVHVFASKVLLRGHNPGRPLFDEGAADDIYVSVRGRKAIVRIQVKSCKIKWHPKEPTSIDLKVAFPASILQEDSSVDIVALCLWDWNKSYIGLFDGEDTRQLQEKGYGSLILRKPPHSKELHFRPKIELTQEPKFFLSGADVTKKFSESGGRWDEIFPSRFISA